MSIKNKLIDYLQERINKKNRKRLINVTPSLICSNCTGGFLYHWLKLEFRSPFINLYLTPKDFITMLEDFDAFLEAGITEDTNNDKNYPVGIGCHGELIHFMHYDSFEHAINSGNKRLLRLDKENMAVLLTNFGGEDRELLCRFEKLPFKNRVVFTNKKYPEFPHSYYIKGYAPNNGRNLYATQFITGARYIDQFDYVDFINHLEDVNG